MYEDLDCFEKALSHFGTRVDMICAMEMGGKIDAETARQIRAFGIDLIICD